MHKILNITYITLVLLTIATAILSNSHKVAFGFIIILGLIKFWVVAYMYMDLRKAHVFWKSLIVIWGIVLGTAIILFS